MRGARLGFLALLALLALLAGIRIIPADARSTWCVTTATRTRRDHPRGCEEHLAQSRQFGPAHGSSPRMRGARVSGGHTFSERGIIPADAGSTEVRIY